jgi:hypothetical protein
VMHQRRRHILSTTLSTIHSTTIPPSCAVTPCLPTQRGDYDAFDMCNSDRFNDICAVTSVLKNYFRLLPDLLLTSELHKRFMSAARVRDLAAKTKALQDLVVELPSEHYHTVKLLVSHLH